jgi:hypothetical protein
LTGFTTTSLPSSTCSLEHDIFSSVWQCERRLWLGQGDSAAAFVLRHACQKTAIVLSHVLQKGTRRAAALLTDVLHGKLSNSTLTVLDIATVLAAERANYAVLARADTLRQRLLKKVPVMMDLHTHHAASMSSLWSLTVIGREPAF